MKPLEAFGWDEFEPSEAPESLSSVASVRAFRIRDEPRILGDLVDAEVWAVYAHKTGRPAAFFVGRQGTWDPCIQIAPALKSGVDAEAEAAQHLNNLPLTVVQPAIAARSQSVYITSAAGEWELRHVGGFFEFRSSPQGVLLVDAKETATEDANELDRYVYAAARLGRLHRHGWGRLRRFMIAILP